MDFRVVCSRQSLSVVTPEYDEEQSGIGSERLLEGGSGFNTPPFMPESSGFPTQRD